MSQSEHASPSRVDRRELFPVAGAALAASVTLATSSKAQSKGWPKMNAIDDTPVGARLQGAQHFGLTVQNMDRAFEFYTEVLGGAEIMRDGDFYSEPIHNTPLADQEIIAHELRVDPRTIGVPD
jgi:hypothetical protein